ncbi:hypothetical protein FNW02_32385 [Komarekiella sp. 'clone 1']|uniref:Uncharacterized protein n=1 Tax=Komarekiella delphini-convector SJRDD-AB1 TaxID=2593771 RepID=A0AA40VUR9_9NOST|nr:hypothetical protein [Komarekiella delphini-convector]MBD6620357.1 hypothetical protein [Komarekiella delphini-convector SJRDD-AB1]
MNVKLVNSLVEVVLNLSPEDQKLFQEKLSNRQIEATTRKSLTSTEKADQFRQWLAQFPKSNANLSNEALCRENIYDDRGR